MFFHNGRSGSTFLPGARWDSPRQDDSHDQISHPRRMIQIYFAALVSRMDRMSNAFTRLMFNLGNPSASVCKMYAGAVISYILYGPDASDADDNARIKCVLYVQRKLTLRLARAYSSVFHPRRPRPLREQMLLADLAASYSQTQA